MYTVFVLKVSAELLGDVLYFEILLQSRQDFRGLQDVEFLDGVGVDPFFNLALDAWEIGRGSNNLVRAYQWCYRHDKKCYEEKI